MGRLNPFTPARLAIDPAGPGCPDSVGAKPVRRRILFYLPGYDPEAQRRYRTLFVRELRIYAKRFGIPLPRLSRPTLSGDGQVQTWSVVTDGPDGGTDTTYNVLLWDDLVRRDMARPMLASAGLNALALLHVALTGALFRLYRASWKCGNVILYPFVMSLLLPGAVVLIAAASHGVFGLGLGLPLELGVAIGVLGGLYALWRAGPWLERAFLRQLMNDWNFNWQIANGRRPDYAARLDTFVAHILSQIGGAAADEILFVGHSTGALTAVELVARLLAREPRLGREGPVLSLLTLGSSLPIVAMQSRACATRAEIASLTASERLIWVDYQAPQDWMNFPGFDPTRDLRLAVPAAGIANPVIRSAKFREIVDAETYRTIRAHPFRMHFQFLMANDAPGVFDIFALCLGPQSLGRRVLAEDSALLGGDRAAMPEPKVAPPLKNC